MDINNNKTLDDNKIIVQALDKTGKLNRNGEFFRVQFQDNSGRRHSAFCSDVQEALDTIKNALEDRAIKPKKKPVKKKPVRKKA